MLMTSKYKNENMHQNISLTVYYASQHTNMAKSILYDMNGRTVRGKSWEGHTPSEGNCSAVAPGSESGMFNSKSF